MCCSTFIKTSTPRAASAPTDIYLPKLHYPQGYTVALTGAPEVSINITRP